MAHPRIENELKNLTIQTYGLQDMSDILCRHAATDVTSQLTAIQRRILSKPVRVRNGDKQCLLTLKQWFDIFDQAFFFGQLADKLTPPAIQTYRPDSGVTWLGYYRPHERRIYINTTPSRRKPGSELVEKQIAVLLHEMLHAFLHIFMCDKHRERSLSPQMVGDVQTSGHYTAWIDAMKALQDRLSIHVTWHVDCSIRDSINYEMSKTEHQFSPEQFERWGLPYATVEAAKKAYPKEVHAEFSRMVLRVSDNISSNT